MIQVFAAIGVVFVVLVCSTVLGCLLAFLEIRWPGFTDRAGERVWGRDVWRNK